jgi:lipase
MARVSSDDPFALTFQVPVAGGNLNVARAGPPPEEAEGVAIAAHGLTPALMTWRTVARRLDAGICLLAPDLRGRGRSASLPGPYGMAAHVADLIAVLDHVGAPPAVVVGHSSGAYVAERLAGEHPERATAVVLLDAGLPSSRPDLSGDVVGLPLAMTFPSADWAVQVWRSHAALADDWDADIEAHVRYNLAERGGLVGLAASAEAVRTDLAEMGAGDANRSALERVRVPVHLLRAERGVLNDEPVISDDELREFAADYPSVHIEQVAGTTHYTIVLGPGPGAYRVAAAIEQAVRGPRAASRDPRTEPEHADHGR